MTAPLSPLSWEAFALCSLGATVDYLGPKKRRSAYQVMVRKVVAHGLRQMGLSLPDIAAELGHSSHASVSHALEQLTLNRALQAHAESLWAEYEAYQATRPSGEAVRQAMRSLHRIGCHATALAVRQQFPEFFPTQDKPK